jgi:26S proteasome regulatory subunit N4
MLLHQHQRTSPTTTPSRHYHHYNNSQPDLPSQSQSLRQSSHHSQNWYLPYSNPPTPVQSVYDSRQAIPLSAEQSTALFDYDTPQHTHNFNNLRIEVRTPSESSQDHDLMLSDHTTATSNWHFANGQLTPTSTRSHHHRESSLSSLGSAGPSSPYTHNTSHPQVLLPSDSVGEVYYDGLPSSDQSSYQTFAKSPLHPSSQESFLAPAYQPNYNIQQYNSDTSYASMMALQRQNTSGEEIPEYGRSDRQSVASTRESPVTPSAVEAYEDQTRKIGETSSTIVEQWMNENLLADLYPEFRSTNTIPKLDRTMSDVYNDELYSPSFSFTSAPPPKLENTMLSPSQQSDIFSQRLQAANSQHLSASSQPALPDQSRGRSPFRQGSPLAPSMSNFGSQPSPQLRLGSAASLREQQKAENDARALQEQIKRNSPEQATPKTISPKDALLDYHETEEDASMPLFPPQAAPQYRQQNNTVHESQSDVEDNASQQSFGSMATSTRESSSTFSNSSRVTQQANSGFAFVPPSLPGGIQARQQYPFVPQQRRQISSMSSSTDRTPDFPSTLTSMESSSSEFVPDQPELKKPAGTTADGGTYTCTYHGCTLRFETPAKLQKHKREGHRQSAPLTGSATDGGSGMTSAALSRENQQGPHYCKRINPSTNKPCNTVFSRPYDLTRHEDTIHNARKQKVRCPLCTEEKTFSRNDALTRHYRVVHPQSEIPGRKRRGE